MQIYYTGYDRYGKKDCYRYVNAGTLEIYRWGDKAIKRAKQYLQPNAQGFYSIPAYSMKYWCIGTSTGKFGEYAKFDDVFLSVNSYGNVWAKVGTPKAETFVKLVESIIYEMEERHGYHDDEDDEEEEIDE